MRACEKRPVSIEQIDETVERIERRVCELCIKELPSQQLGDFMMDELMHLDEIAYVRFASVYREFSDAKQFVETLQNLARRATSRGAKSSSPVTPKKAANE